MSSFRIDVADLLHHPGARRTVRLTQPVEDLAGTGASVPDPVAVILDLERISEGIVVRGTISATWRGDCARCLAPRSELLELPLAPHCDPPCPLPSPANDDAEPDVDPRWRALSDLEL